MCAIPDAYHEQPGVEFVVSAERKGKREVLLSRTLDPRTRGPDREWIRARRGPLEVRRAARPRSSSRRGASSRRTTRCERLWGNPADHRGRDEERPARHRLPRGHAAGRPHDGLRLRAATRRPSSRSFAKDAVVFDQADRPRLVDQAVGGLHPDVAAARPAPRGPAARHARLLQHARLRAALARRASPPAGVIANAVVYLRRGQLRPGLRLLRRAARRGAASRASSSAPTSSSTRPCGWLDTRKGLPTFLYVHTMDPHVPYAPPAPFDQMFEPHPLPDRPAADPRTDYKEPADRERLIAQYDGDIAFGDQEFGRFLRELRGPGPLRPTRSSSSSPTTARSSWTTVSGSTAAASSTSSSACPSSSSSRGQKDGGHAA